MKAGVVQGQFKRTGECTTLSLPGHRFLEQAGADLLAPRGRERIQLLLALIVSAFMVYSVAALGFRAGEIIAERTATSRIKPETVAPDSGEATDTLLQPFSTKVKTGSSSDFTPRGDPAGRSRYIYLVRTEAKRNGLPVQIADAVAFIESAYNPVRIGDAGEIGLMQVRPSTARMLGFHGSAAELFNPRKNLRYGILYLAQAWRLAKGDLCRALMKYRAGHLAQNMTPKSTEYCSRAKAYLATHNWHAGRQG